jgi:hypothetical protein
MVTGRFAHRLYLLRAAGQQQRSDGANLRVLHAHKPSNFLATIQGHKFFSRMVAGWFAADVHVQHVWQS